MAVITALQKMTAAYDSRVFGSPPSPLLAVGQHLAEMSEPSDVVQIGDYIHINFDRPDAYFTDHRNGYDPNGPTIIIGQEDRHTSVKVTLGRIPATDLDVWRRKTARLLGPIGPHYIRPDECAGTIDLRLPDAIERLEACAALALLESWPHTPCPGLLARSPGGGLWAERLDPRTAACLLATWWRCWLALRFS